MSHMSSNMIPVSTFVNDHDITDGILPGTLTTSQKSLQIPGMKTRPMSKGQGMQMVNYPNFDIATTQGRQSQDGGDGSPSRERQGSMNKNASQFEQSPSNQQLGFGGSSPNYNPEGMSPPQMQKGMSSLSPNKLELPQNQSPNRRTTVKKKHTKFITEFKQQMDDSGFMVTTMQPKKIEGKNFMFGKMKIQAGGVDGDSDGSSVSRRSRRPSARKEPVPEDPVIKAQREMQERMKRDMMKQNAMFSSPVKS